jgi:hypothetical protein
MVGVGVAVCNEGSGDVDGKPLAGQNQDGEIKNLRYDVCRRG